MRALRLLSNSPIRLRSALKEHPCRNNYLPSLSVNRGSQSFRNILVGGHAWILAWLPLQNFLDPIQHYTLVCVAEERNGIALGNNIRAAGRFHNLVRRSSQLVVGPALKHLYGGIRKKKNGESNALGRGRCLYCMQQCEYKIASTYIANVHHNTAQNRWHKGPRSVLTFHTETSCLVLAQES
jgi:hypothetical protein